jgi:hypothetical protein
MTRQYRDLVEKAEQERNVAFLWLAALIKRHGPLRVTRAEVEAAEFCELASSDVGDAVVLTVITAPPPAQRRR